MTAEKLKPMAEGLAGRSDPTSAADAIYELFTTDPREGCARIASPTPGAWAAYKGQATREQEEENFRQPFARLKGMRLVVRDIALHFLMLDDSDWTYGQIDKFLAEAARTH
jgi:hypothetical protein